MSSQKTRHPLPFSAPLKIPKTIWVLGFVSLFMDLSSELVHSILPVFLVSTLGTSVATVGLIEGTSESIALIVKVFSGTLSDFFRHRKLLILAGYGLAALTKPLFPLAGSAETVFFARFLDRIGKGIRGAPRDALIADVAPAPIRGACFGLRQSMDTVGAVLGPLAATVLLWMLANDIKQVLWFATLPAIVTVFLIVVGVKEPDRATDSSRPPIRFAALKQFTGDYWRLVIVGAIFTLARFSEAFLVLRARQAGFSTTFIPLVMVIMSLVYALAAYPAGVLSDRISRRLLLLAGLFTLLVSDLVFAWAKGPLGIVLGVILWGLHMGLTQGILSAMIADTTPPDLKGTAFGVFNLASGICMLFASLLAGILWEKFNPSLTFYAGAAFTVLAMSMLLCLGRGKNTDGVME
jgi:MFS family permease